MPTPKRATSRAGSGKAAPKPASKKAPSGSTSGKKTPDSRRLIPAKTGKAKADALRTPGRGRTWADGTSKTEYSDKPATGPERWGNARGAEAAKRAAEFAKRRLAVDYTGNRFESLARTRVAGEGSSGAKSKSGATNKGTNKRK
jgi:hypothetical protein